jgi:hypothetical protein
MTPLSDKWVTTVGEVFYKRRLGKVSLLIIQPQAKRPYHLLVGK